jgi:hypothetical protein
MEPATPCFLSAPTVPIASQSSQNARRYGAITWPTGTDDFEP